jgi:ubiquinone/menaquinone biosynthesis C-methylase UbiE
MTRLAKRNTNQRANITRGLAQQLPFADSTFDVIVATFPAEYITDRQTLLEVQRCLSDGGRFVVLPVAMQMGRRPPERAMSLLFRITHQTPVDPIEEVKERLRKPFSESGFKVELKELQVQSSLLLVILATK